MSNRERLSVIMLHEPWGLCARYLDPDLNIVGLTSRG